MSLFVGAVYTFTMRETYSDAFGHHLQHIHQEENPSHTRHTVERDDGFAEEYEGAEYFNTYSEWPLLERQAVDLARGKVLDIGCGAGKHALYLQEQ